MAADVAEACRSAVGGAGQTVVLALPLDVQSMPVGDAALLAVRAMRVGDPGLFDMRAMPGGDGVLPGGGAAAGSSDSGCQLDTGPELGPLVDALAAARRPVFIAGRGATRGATVARAELAALAERRGSRETSVLDLYDRACGWGYLPGCTAVARLYDAGTVVARDENRALELYRSACMAGEIGRASCRERVFRVV